MEAGLGTRHPGEFGFSLASQTLDPMVLPGNQAVLCLGGDIGRFNAPAQVGVSGADGTLSLSLDLGSLVQQMGSVAGMAGETWYFQASNPLPTSSFTDALSATLTQSAERDCPQGPRRQQAEGILLAGGALRPPPTTTGVT